MRIGLDFDNTIAGYDHLFLAAGREQGLLPPDFAGAKKAVRDHIRTLPGGEAFAIWGESQGKGWMVGFWKRLKDHRQDGFLLRKRGCVPRDSSLDPVS